MWVVITEWRGQPKAEDGVRVRNRRFHGALLSNVSSKIGPGPLCIYTSKVLMPPQLSPSNRCALRTKGLQGNAQLFQNKDRKTQDQIHTDSRTHTNWTQNATLRHVLLNLQAITEFLRNSRVGEWKPILVQLKEVAFLFPRSAIHT